MKKICVLFCFVALVSIGQNSRIDNLSVNGMTAKSPISVDGAPFSAVASTNGAAMGLTINGTLTNNSIPAVTYNFYTNGFTNGTGQRGTATLNYSYSIGAGLVGIAALWQTNAGGAIKVTYFSVPNAGLGTLAGSNSVQFPVSTNSKALLVPVVGTFTVLTNSFIEW